MYISSPQQYFETIECQQNFIGYKGSVASGMWKKAQLESISFEAMWLVSDMQLSIDAREAS